METVKSCSNVVKVAYKAMQSIDSLELDTQFIDTDSIVEKFKEVIEEAYEEKQKTLRHPSFEEMAERAEKLRGNEVAPKIELKDIKPGDILQWSYPEDREYVFKDSEGKPCINACSRSWIEQGIESYGEVCFSLNEEDIKGATVIEHYGSGFFSEGNAWYEKTFGGMA